MTPMISIFRAILIALCGVAILAGIGIRLAWRIRLIDYPESAPHKRHERPTPIAGGAVMMIVLWLSAWLLGLLDDLTVRAALLAAIPVFLFGLWDDYKIISPALKLVGQILAALVILRIGVYIKIFESRQFFIYGEGFIYQLMDWSVTILWIVGLTNAFNFVDSMDGLAVGLGGTSAAFFMLVTLEANQPLLAQFSALLLGACIGLYLYNSPPASLFLGDSGAQTLGFILAVVAIGYKPQNSVQLSSWFAPILLLIVPIFDMFLVVVSRLRRRRPVYFSALDHTFHRLLKMGMPSSRAVLVIHIVALALGCLAVITVHQPPLAANTIFLLVLVTGGCLLAILDSQKIWPV
ncbi:MAG: undecaprenyl/decaprenyl-phosphate alpha-N-acetylglucosaminyl 1-phosphate transferase [Anaerolineales bacterium]|nr:undecaprenyl/decaprenyl-phosphate alpha-N-acetylglucosaminyl 1-phosphate transferase [Anaerolineales bacterium]